jgi:hypothetical protein
MRQFPPPRYDNCRGNGEGREALRLKLGINDAEKRVSPVGGAQAVLFHSKYYN